MATSEIAQSIQDITGSSSLNSHSIVDAQKFVVASIPKDLMWGYSAATSGVTSNPVTTNSTLTNTDSILLVKRGDFTAEQASHQMRGFLGAVNLTSVTTNAPDAGDLITFTKSSHGLTAGKTVKLSSFVAVLGGATQDFFNGLSSQVTVVDANSFTLQGVVMPSSDAPPASTGTVSTASESLFAPSVKYPKFVLDDANEISVFPIPNASYEGKVLYVHYANVDDDSDLRNAVIYHASSAEFSKLAVSKVTDWVDVNAPVAPSSPDFGGDLTIDSVSPVAPALSDSTVSFSETIPSYAKPVFSAPTLSSVGSLTLPNAPVAPSLSTSSVSFSSSAPTYQRPVVSLPSLTTITELDITDVAPVAPSLGDTSITFNTTAPTFATPVVAPDFSSWQSSIDDEDIEIAEAKLRKVSHQLNKYNADIQSAIQSFNDDKAEYDAQLQISIQNAQLSSQDDAKELQRYASELQSYQFSVNKNVQEFTSNLTRNTQQFQIESQVKLGEYQANIQNELNAFNNEATRYKAQLQVSLQNVQLEDSADTKKLQKFQSELQAYQVEVNSTIQKWTAEEWTQNFQKYQTDYGSLLQTYQVDVANELNKFNKESAVYQAQLQISVQNAQLSSQDDAQKLQKYGAEVGVYQQDVQKEVQDFVNTLQKEAQEYQSKIGLYSAELQKFQVNVGEQAQKIANSARNSVQYSNESKKYYEWARGEISMFIQNNSKILTRQMAAQSAQQQSRR